jgi:hypothetical protein
MRNSKGSTPVGDQSAWPVAERGKGVHVSAQDPDELERAVADIEQAAIQASGETRRL